ncbi:hypothetical protein PRABACTJOHN_01806 [Parabacteroides johnsonii DSM 18315]|uniref:Uncharacterized protein n=1 Tax=Parabacteroides johnsonii DSM 18315 TaxID=537006 RepID=B7B9V3_9BACT|nr:hypothetical protein PRABACTJOHN_01806 [Parabacteroides johnsonii DSM 18315]
MRSRALHFYDDRSHDNNDRPHHHEVPNSSYTKSDFTAMKTVIIEIICASLWNKSFF